MNARLIFLRDVLGIEQWIATPVAVAMPAVPVALIQIQKSWSAAERALVEKILSATGLQGLPTVAGPARSSHILIFDTEGPPAREANGPQICWKTGRLRPLIEGDAASIQSAKRDVWNLIKRMKEEAGV